MTPLTQQFVQAHSGVGFRFDTEQWLDRDLAIGKHLQLEEVLMEITLIWLQKMNPSLDVEAAREKLLIEGPLGSASKLTTFLRFAGVLEGELADDISAFCKLRHRYAHDHGRGQLRDEPDLMKLLSNTNTYKQGRALLVDLNKQGVLVCIFAKLMLEVDAAKCRITI